MLKNEAGVTALRTLFEQDDQQQGRDTLKFKAGLFQRSTDVKQIETHAKIYLKVLKDEKDKPLKAAGIMTENQTFEAPKTHSSQVMHINEKHPKDAENGKISERNLSPKQITTPNAEKPKKPALPPKPKNVTTSSTNNQCKSSKSVQPTNQKAITTIDTDNQVKIEKNDDFSVKQQNGNDDENDRQLVETHMTPKQGVQTYNQHTEENKSQEQNKDCETTDTEDSTANAEVQDMIQDFQRNDYYDFEQNGNNDENSKQQVQNHMLQNQSEQTNSANKQHIEKNKSQEQNKDNRDTDTGDSTANAAVHDLITTTQKQDDLNKAPKEDHQKEKETDTFKNTKEEHQPKMTLVENFEVEPKQTEMVHEEEKALNVAEKRNLFEQNLCSRYTEKEKETDTFKNTKEKHQHKKTLVENFEVEPKQTEMVHIEEKTLNVAEKRNLFEQNLCSRYTEKTGDLDTQTQYDTQVTSYSDINTQFFRNSDEENSSCTTIVSDQENEESELQMNNYYTDVKRKKRFRKHRNQPMSGFDTRRSSITDSVISTTSNSSTDSAEKAKRQIKYMATQVYRDWIKHQIRVTDMLPLLSLGQSDVEGIISKHKACPSDALEMLLDFMEDSDIPGIWQQFLDALDELKISHISDLLQNKTEIHHSHTTNILRLVSHDLKQRICIPDFLDLVFEKELLVESEYDEAYAVFKERGPQEAAKIIIESVNKHLLRWDKVFADVLDKSGMHDIAELFRFVEQTQPLKNSQKKENKNFHKTLQPMSQKLGERRLEQWTRSFNLQQTFNEAESEPRSQAGVYNITTSNYSSLCLAVDQIQSKQKVLSNDIKDIKTILDKILERLPKPNNH